jgi:ankyrin repeat protein
MTYGITPEYNPNQLPFEARNNRAKLSLQAGSLSNFILISTEQEKRMRQPANLRQMTLRVLTVIVASALLLCAGSQAFAQNDDANRRLTVAVVGFELNEAAAKDALAAGADINWKNDAMNGETLLIQAIKSFKDAEVVRFLLNNGANPNLTDDSGRTALSWARHIKSTVTATAERSSRC